MSNTYVTALIESLEKKNKVLDEILIKNEEQAALLKEAEFSFDKFDKSIEEKGVLIYRLEKLDEGFEAFYAKVKAELDSDRKKYKSSILKMQMLITDITDKSSKIQAGEARNKAALEAFFRGERDKLKAGRSGVNAVKSYNRVMNMLNQN